MDEDCVDEAVQLATRVINQCNRLPAGRSRRRLIQDATDELCNVVERTILTARAAARERAINATHGGTRVRKRLRRTIESDSSESEGPREDHMRSSRTHNRGPRRENPNSTPMSLVDSSSGDESVESEPRRRRTSTRNRRQLSPSSTPSPSNMVRTRSRAASMPEVKYMSEPEEPRRNTRRSSRLASVAAAKIEQRSEAEEEDNQEEEADDEAQSDASDDENSQIESDSDSDVDSPAELVMPVVRPRPFVKPNPLSTDWASNTPRYSTDDEDTDEEANLKRRRERNYQILANNQSERLRPLFEEIENAPVELSEPETVSDKNDSDWHPTSWTMPPRSTAPYNQHVNPVPNAQAGYHASAPGSYSQSYPVAYHPPQQGIQQAPVPLHPPTVNNTSVRYMFHNVSQNGVVQGNNQLGQPGVTQRGEPNLSGVTPYQAVRQFQQSSGITPNRTPVPANGAVAASVDPGTQNSNQNRPASNLNITPQVGSLGHIQAQQHRTVTQNLPASTSATYGLPQTGTPSAGVAQSMSTPQNQYSPLAYVQAQQTVQYQAELNRLHVKIEALRHSQLQARQRAESHAAQAMQANSKADEEARKLLEVETELRRRAEMHRQEVTRAKSLANAHLVANKKAVIEANHFTQIHNTVVHKYIELRRKYRENQNRMNQMMLDQQKHAQTESALEQIERQFQLQISKASEPTSAAMSNPDTTALENVLNANTVVVPDSTTQMHNNLGKPIGAANNRIQPDLSEPILLRYKKAAEEVGIRFVAAESMNLPFTDLATSFKQDHMRYMSSINVRLPTRLLNNTPLDMYKLYKSVLVLGGIQNVIWRSLFDRVSATLQVPPSPTVSTFLLDVYMNDIYPYEQKHVWGRGANELPRLCVPAGVQRNNITPGVVNGSTIVQNQAKVMQQNNVNLNGGGPLKNNANKVSSAVIDTAMPDKQVMNPSATGNVVVHEGSNRKNESVGTT